METQPLHGIEARPDDDRLVALVGTSPGPSPRGSAPRIVGVVGPGCAVYRVFITFGDDEFDRVRRVLSEAGLREVSDWTSSYVFRLHCCFG
jgi:hypothetical protein